MNELLAVLRLLRYVCSHKDAELARLVKRAHARGQIAVPDSECCLVPTSACVHSHNCPPQLLARLAASSAMVTFEYLWSYLITRQTVYDVAISPQPAYEIMKILWHAGKYSDILQIGRVGGLRAPAALHGDVPYAGHPSPAGCGL